MASLYESVEVVTGDVIQDDVEDILTIGTITAYNKTKDGEGMLGVMASKRKNYLHYGVGINDSDYSIKNCPYMRRWLSMLQRCYSEGYHNYKHTYKGCSVCDEWLIFSNFKAWMEQQDWEGKQLDKDLLVKGNKVYSPETCIFVDGRVNSFMAFRNKGKYPIGVTKTKEGYYVSQFSDGSGKKIYRGLYKTPLEAHLPWQVFKMEVGLNLIYSGQDVKVENRLKSIVETLFYDITNKEETTPLKLKGFDK